MTDPAVAKAGWNFFMVESDASKGVHNPGFVSAALDVSIFATEAYTARVAADPTVGGGTGTGAGAVSCTTPFVYWAEIVGHMPGNGTSQWRTDLVARNLATTDASLRLVLHQAGANLEGNGVVIGGGQNAFEDVVAMLGGTNNLGSLEICSDRPLMVMSRIFNRDSTGTFGQSFDGFVADAGYDSGQTLSLIGLRQKTDLFRTNISVTNGGTTEAEVAISLYSASGTLVDTYNLTIPAGQVVMDVEPFKNRANAPDLGWGYATVTVIRGNNIHTSGSVVDMKTNDPTTIPAKQ